jgi:uncharacterized membrane protein
MSRATSCDPHVTNLLHRNISALVNAKKDVEKQRGFQDHLADAITAFSGTMAFVYLHVVWFAGWLSWNLWMAGDQPFDPYPFGMLTTIVSLEAIFLSTFVLITQNRQAQIADRRADLDIQVDLLAEHEITRVLQLSEAIAKRLGIKTENAAELRELERDVDPEEILQEIDAESNKHESAVDARQHAS